MNVDADGDKPLRFLFLWLPRFFFGVSDSFLFLFARACGLCVRGDGYHFKDLLQPEFLVLSRELKLLRDWRGGD